MRRLIPLIAIALLQTSSFAEDFRAPVGRAHCLSNAVAHATPAHVDMRYSTLQLPEFILKPAQLSDEAYFVQLLKTPEVRAMNNSRLEFSLEEHFQDSLPDHSSPDSNHQSFMKLIVDKKTGERAGFIAGDIDRDGKDRYAVLRYVLAPERWGKGWVSQAVQATVHELREHAAVTDVYAYVFDNNKASQRVLEKQGFKRIQSLDPNELNLKAIRQVPLHLYHLMLRRDRIH